MKRFIQFYPMQWNRLTYRSKEVLRKCLFIFLFLSICSTTFGQDRFETIENKLNELSTSTSLGLNEPVKASVSGASIQEFVRGMAMAHGVNLNVDPSLQIQLTLNFTEEPVKNVLLFLCKEYDLEIDFIGSILSIQKYEAPTVEPEKAEPKELEIAYNSTKDQLSFDLRNDTLKNVLKAVTQKSGKNVVMSPGTGNKLVTGFLQNASFESAIDKLAFANGLKSSKTADGFWLIEEVAVESKSNTRNKNQNRNQQGSVSTTPENLEIAIGTDFNNNPLISVNAVNAPIAELIKQTAAKLDIGYFLFSEPEGNTTAKITGLTFDGSPAKPIVLMTQVVNFLLPAPR